MTPREQPADSFDALAHELIRFIRGLKRLRLPQGSDGAPMDRAAFMLLVTLDEHGSLRPSALAEALQVDLSTVSRQMATMETAGLLTRQPDPGDRRAVVLNLTDEGRRVLNVNMTARKQFMRELVADWTEDERGTFTHLMARINDRVHDHGTDPVP